jgi:hypothetical protein
MAAVPLRERASPIKIRIVVVFPAPLGPRNPKIAPRGTVNVRITRAMRLGQVLHLDRQPVSPKVPGIGPSCAVSLLV